MPRHMGTGEFPITVHCLDSLYLAALHYIRKGEKVKHRHWMWRSYSLILAAITLRVYVFLSSWSRDLAQTTAYATIAWLSRVPNLMICKEYIWMK